MIGPQTKTKFHRPINDRIPAMFVFNGNFNGEMAHACLKMANFPQNGHFQACRQWSPRSKLETPGLVEMSYNQIDHI